MILHRLQLKNYKQYTSLDLIFREGLIGIIGKNGAGKSTIFDAVLYCLFGVDEDKKENIRSSYSIDNEPIELLLTFELHNKLYHLRRIFKGKDLAVSAFLYDNQNVLIARDSKQVNMEVAKILNLERNAFKNSVFSGQKELDILSNSNPSARKEMIRKLLGLERLEKIEKKVREDSNQLKNELGGLEKIRLDSEQLQALKQQSEQFKTILSQLNIREEQIRSQVKKIESEKEKQLNLVNFQEKIKDEHTALDLKLTRYNERLNALKNAQDTYLSEKEKLEKSKREIDEEQPYFTEYEKAKTQLEEWQKTKDSILKKDNFISQQKRLKEETQQLESTIQSNHIALKEKENLILQNDDLEKIISKTAQQQSEVQGNIQTISSKISEITGKIQDRQAKLHQLQKLGKETDCPTCFRPLKEKYDETIAFFEKEITDFQAILLSDFEQQKKGLDEKGKVLQDQLKEQQNLKTSMDKKINELHQLEKETTKHQLHLSNLQKEIAQLQQNIAAFGDLQVNENQFEILENTIKKDSNAYQEFEKKKHLYLNNLPKTLQSIEETKNSISKGEAEISLVKKDIEKVAFDPEKFKAIKNQFNETERQFIEKKDEQKTIEIQQIKEQSNLKSVNNKIESDEAINQKIKAINKDHEALKKLTNLVTAFKSKIVQRIAPTISNEAGNLFSLITKGRYEGIEIDEEYNFYVYDQGKKVSLNRLSGGEIDLANLCLRVALTKAIGEINGTQSLNFLAFDEIFGSQDEERRQEIMTALNILQEQFQQIYIISHIESVRDLFPNLLQVSLTSKGSKADWVM